jgi:hypothetical protein
MSDEPSSPPVDAVVRRVFGPGWFYKSVLMLFTVIGALGLWAMLAWLNLNFLSVSANAEAWNKQVTINEQLATQIAAGQQNDARNDERDRATSENMNQLRADINQLRNIIMNQTRNNPGGTTTL